jgi:hypothetical protein
LLTNQRNEALQCLPCQKLILSLSAAEPLWNSKDPNTSADKKRKIVLSFEFAPYIDRSGGNVTVKVETKLSSHQGVDGSFYLRKTGAIVEAFTQDDRQMGIFDGEGEAESVEDAAEVK